MAANKEKEGVSQSLAEALINSFYEGVSMATGHLTGKDVEGGGHTAGVMDVTVDGGATESAGTKETWHHSRTDTMAGTDVGNIRHANSRAAGYTDGAGADTYTAHVKYTPFRELLGGTHQDFHYGDYNTIAAAARSAGYSIMDGANSSSSDTVGSWQVDFTTMSNNDSMSVNGTDRMNALISLAYPSMPAMVIVGTLLIGLAVATAFGNFLVGLALFRYRNLRTVSNYLIGNLAMSDFLLAITILPLSAVHECLGHWVFGHVMCYFWLCTDVLYCTASIWNLCIIAFDRFTATLYPVWYREKRSPKQAAIYVSVVWLFSIAICIPPLLGWNDLSASYIYDNTTNVYQCMLFQTPSYIVYSAMGSFYIPFILTVFLYIRIFGVLYTRMKKMRASQAARRRAQKQMASAPQTAPFNKETAEATNPLCVKEAETPMTGQAPQTIEMEAVALQQGNDGSGNTEELSSKSLFGSDSPSEDDSSSTALAHHRGHKDEEASSQNVVKNGKVGKHKHHKEKGDKSETMVIFNPNHNFNTDSEKDDVKIVVCADTNGEGDAHKKNNNCEGPQNSPATTNGDKKNKNISNVLKPTIFNKPAKPPKKKASIRRRQDQREMRATIRMAIIIAFFCGCWIGFFTTYLLRGIFGEDKIYIPRTLDAFFFWLGYSNSGMNPILYTIFNEDFRKAFQKLLGCYSKSRHGNGPAYGKTRS